MKKSEKKDGRRYPLGGIGLKPEEEVRLLELLDEKDLSLKQICRALLRKWMAEGGKGVLEYSKK